MKALDAARALSARESSNGWLACCPAHDDKNASLAIAERNGKMLLTCFAGCTFEEIVSALKAKGVKDEFEEKKTEYFYQDGEGNPRLRVTRIDELGGKKFFQSHYELGEYKPGRGTGEIAPYKYSFWKDFEVVFLSEGEKCAEALAGQPSTCIPGGAKGWKEEYAKFFAGKKVYILPDNDEPGIEFAKQVHAALSKVAQPQIVNLPVGPKEDIVDYLYENSIKDLLKLVEEVPTKWQKVSDFEKQEEYCEKSYGKEIPFGLSFLDKAFVGVCRNDLILVGAKSGSGKTQLVTSIAANAVLQGKRVYQFALEAHPYEITARIRYQLLSKKFFDSGGYHKHLLYDKLNYVDWVRGKFKNTLFDLEEEVRKDLKEKYNNYFVQYKISTFSAADLVGEMNQLRDVADLIIIDHFHFLDFDVNENKSMTDAAAMIREVALSIGIPVILVAHVRKTDKRMAALVPEQEDFQGTSNLYKVCTKAIMLAPAYEHQRTSTEIPTYVRIAKFREDMSRCAYLGLVDFDVAKQRYKDEFSVGRLTPDGKTFKAIENEADRPYWVKGTVEYECV